jgi:endonuclease YncB( thermonuclease family)
MDNLAPAVGRPRGNAWRALQAEGVVWEGQVLLPGGDVDLAARLIVTHQRLAFVRGGVVALDVPRDWIRPAPALLPDGEILFSITPAIGAATEKIKILIREGRRPAAHLVSLLSGAGVRPVVPGLPKVYDPPPPKPNPGEQALRRVMAEPISTPPSPPQARSVSKYAAEKWEPAGVLPSISILDMDDFPPIRDNGNGNGGEHAENGALAVPDRSLPAPVSSGPRRNSNWNLEPITALSPRESRASRRGWAIRLSGLILLLFTITAYAAGHLPDSPNRVTDRIPAASDLIGKDDPTPTPEPEKTAASIFDNQTPLPAQTAEVIGVGGLFEVDATSTEPGGAAEIVEPTATATATATATIAPTDTPAPTSTPEPTDTPQPTNTPEPTKAEVAPAEVDVPPTNTPEPTQTPEPTETTAPTATNTPEPTAVPTEVPPTQPPATVEPSPTATTTTEQSLPATVTEEMPTVTSTMAPTASETSTAQPTSTATATSTPAQFPPQAPDLEKDETPKQVVDAGHVRYTLTSAVRGAEIPELSLPVSPWGDWVVLVIDGNNWSDQPTTLTLNDTQFVTIAPTEYISYLDTGTGAIAQFLGLDPAYGYDDEVTFNPGQNERFALVFTVDPGATNFELWLGETPINMDEALETANPVVDLGPAPNKPDLLTARVVDVIDGKTILVEANGETATIVYNGIDAPTGTDCFAAEATAANEELVGGRLVLLERQRFNTNQGNLARDVWVVNADGSRELVAAALVAEGAATPDIRDPDSRFAGWLTANKDHAETAGLGLWGACETESATDSVPAVSAPYLPTSWGNGFSPGDIQSSED